jgi:hypothetical protein
MSFALGLAQGLGQTLQDRLNEKRQREQAEWQMQHDMKRQQLLFEQQQAQAPQLMQQKFDLEKQFRPQVEEQTMWKSELDEKVKNKLKEISDQIEIKTTPGFREALISGDEEQIGKLLKTQADADFLNVFKKATLGLESPYDKETGRQKAKTEGAIERQKAGVGGKSGGRGGRSGGGASTKATPENKSRRTKVMRDIAKTEGIIDGLIYAIQNETNPTKRAQYLEEKEQQELRMSEHRQMLGLLDNETEVFDVPAAANEKKSLAGVRPEIKKAVESVKSDKDIEKLSAMGLSEGEVKWANERLNQKRIDEMIDKFAQNSRKYIDAAMPKRNVVKRTEAK